MITIFLIQAVLMFLAFAYLFYMTTMTGNDDYSKMFTKVYLVMVAVLAIGAYCLSSTSNSPTKTAAVQSLQELDYV